MSVMIQVIGLFLLSMSLNAAQDTCDAGGGLVYSFTFCPNAFCLAGSYSCALGEVGSFSMAENLTGCLSDCDREAGCSLATWCPLCSSPRCFLFTSCNVWERNPVVLDPLLGINDICEVERETRGKEG
ncbi:hypothetical protein GUITHDRAFT_120606 [Guillardia theta CCMP2712]|uniref:Apple domain-containing protein n=1 Tax=Guillardia theta (strain CCMP2712) TaxID=905079 RepID=L1IAB6_GUITC|nr:hypothetical protein GUITHDRAFT_120606 [Guillardia theta CCMP2712]EKX33206.1 hypothetical protein GUITHDRAFT_120606 [Guillardia theta CCMP2712]|eukprot:XP_005820186.1 hypothetical protein GUITHDRAFT_120606 [Guillardia theta CCMP2712]